MRRFQSGVPAEAAMTMRIPVQRPRCAAGSALAALGMLVAICSTAEGFFVQQDIVSPAITANPIEVVVWVKTGVTAENEARVLDQIRQGLQMWEDVPTAHIRFTIVNIIRSATDPGKQPHQVQIIVGNQADLTMGGASLPYMGNPGTWFGAVADVPSVQLVPVTAHEVGHAIGFHHSTLSTAYPVLQRPIMHFAISSPVVLQDDVAMISSAYPQAGQTLADVGGTIRGRLVTTGSSGTTPIPGVNVVAVNTVTGLPTVARISAISGALGSFELVGLPPGRYQLQLKDGHSYAGSFLGFWREAQADNFTPFSIGSYQISVGQVLDVGDIPITLFPLSIDGVHIGRIDQFTSISLTPIGAALPMATLSSPYEVWVHLKGGLRALSAHVAGLPPGLGGWIAEDPRVANVRTYGSQFVRIRGTPTGSGMFTPTITVIDARDAIFSVTLSLLVGGGEANPPVVAIINPASGAEVSHDIPVTVSASDDVGVVTVEYFKDADTTPFAIRTASPFAATFSPSRVAPGAHTLVAKAYDAAGNTGKSARVPVVVVKLGDTNRDGVLTVADAMTALNMVAGEVAPDLVAGDVNLDGAVMAADALCILKASVGLITLPCSTSAARSLATTRAGAGTLTLPGSPTATEALLLDPLCQSSCGRVEFPLAETVRFGVPVPAYGSVFTGWSGACTGMSTCTVTVNAQKTLTANFAAVPHLLSNGGFEEGKTDWSGWGTNKRLLTAATLEFGETIFEGANAAKILLAVDGARSLTHNTLPVTPGAVYQVSAVIRTASATGTARVELMWKSAAGGTLRTNAFGATTGTVNWTVRRPSVSLTAPANAAKLQVRLVTTPGTGVAYFDGVRVEQK